MTSLLEGAKRLVTRGGSDTGERLAGLDDAVQAARDYLDDPVVEDAATLVDSASRRLRLSAEHTVVALAGATGSGKSSTYNALSGLDLAAVGVRRPTTSWATACVWGSEGADELLDWLEIAPRHRVMRDSMLDSRTDEEMQGVVLLDLPDHDSTEVSHHLEVDRLVKLADLLIWVLDPQKYADAAIHQRYLAPMAAYADVMIVVLNHLDEVPESRREGLLADVRRLLDADGLHDVPVLGISARHGTGVAELRHEVARRVARKKDARKRMDTDVRSMAERLGEVSGRALQADLSTERVAALDDALAEAAGVPVVVQAVADATKVRAERATGWPLVSWVSRLRPDPLKRLHLDLGEHAGALRGRSRTSVPQATEVQRARVDTEVRALADQVSLGLGRQWSDAIRRASTGRLGDLNDRLDRVLGDTELGPVRAPAWAGPVRILQWVLLLVAIVGLGWTALIAAVGAMPDPSKVAGIPLPVVMLVGGLLAGLLLALVCRGLVSMTARRRAHAVDQRLREGIAAVAQELVVAPVQEVLAAQARVRDGLDRALR